MEVFPIVLEGVSSRVEKEKRSDRYWPERVWSTQGDVQEAEVRVYKNKEIQDDSKITRNGRAVNSTHD